MHGQITKFDNKLGYGVIAGEDGRKYRFAHDEVVNLNGRLVGYEVDFLIKAARARDVILMTGTPFTVFADPRKRKG